MGQGGAEPGGALMWPCWSPWGAGWHSWWLTWSTTCGRTGRRLDAPSSRCPCYPCAPRTPPPSAQRSRDQGHASGPKPHTPAPTPSCPLTPSVSSAAPSHPPFLSVFPEHLVPLSLSTNTIFGAWSFDAYSAWMVLASETQSCQVHSGAGHDRSKNDCRWCVCQLGGSCRGTAWGASAWLIPKASL